MTQEYNNLTDPPSRRSQLFTICVWLAILSAVVAFYALCGKSIIRETKPQYRQFMDTSFHQGDYVPSVKYFVLGSLTAYTAREEETDSTPFITASGETVRNGIVANNCLPFHSIVEILGDKYVVLDRMNSRYDCEHFDLFMWSLEDARNFGVKNLIVKVF
jgi:3D (Asp-Asp-Asp) domain-containing protein